MDEKLYVATEVAKMTGRTHSTIRGISYRYNLGVKRGSIRLYTESDVAFIRSIAPSGGRPAKSTEQLNASSESDLTERERQQWDHLIADLQQALEKLEKRIDRQRQELHSARQTVSPRAGETVGDLMRRLGERESKYLAAYFAGRKEVEDKFAERAERERQAREAYRTKWYKEDN